MTEDPKRVDPNRPRLGYTPMYDPPEYGRDATPGVILWFRIYSIAMALSAFFLIGFGVILSAASSQPGVHDQVENQGLALVVILFGVALSVLHVVAACIPKKPWGWTLGMVTIIVGMMGGGCAILFAIPLVIYWVKPETKAAFGRLPI
jgi:hypothetical protein